MYELIISNIGLVLANYPFDFFFRFKQRVSGQYNDSPIIQANSLQFQQQFPWRFQFQENSIIFEFIQITRTNKEIVRGRKSINNIKLNKMESLGIIGNRLNKKISIIQYQLRQLNDLDKIDEKPELHYQSHRKYTEQQQQQQDSNYSNRNRINRKNYQKQQKQQYCTKQLQNMKESINYNLASSKKDDQKFNSYLKHSSDVIQQFRKKPKLTNSSVSSRSLDNQLEELYKAKMTKIQTPQKNQQKQVSSEGQIPKLSEQMKKWYRRKFQAPTPKYVPNLQQQYLKLRKQSNNYPSQQIEILKKQPVNDTKFMTLTDIFLQTSLKPSQLMLLQIKNINNNQEDLSLICNAKSTNLCYIHTWNIKVELPIINYIMINLKDSLNKKQAFIFIGKQQQSKRSSYIFTQKGQISGYVRFKIQYRQQTEAQTNDQLDNISFNTNLSVQRQSNSNQPIKNNIQVDQNSGINNNANMKSEISKTSQYYQQSISSYQNLINQQKVYNSNRLKVQPNKQDEKSTNRKRYSLMQSQIRPFQINDQYSPKNKKLSYNSNNIAINLNPITQQPLNKLMNRRSNSTDINLNKFTNPLNNITRTSKKSQQSNIIKQINLKISTISIKISQIDPSTVCTVHMKISLKNSHKNIITPNLKNSKNILWMNDKYVFEGVSPYQQITIQVFSTHKQSTRREGFAKISLVLLSLDQFDKVKFFHDFLRDQKHTQIGQIIIGYQNIKNAKIYNISNKYPNSKDDDEQSITMALPTKKYHKNKIKSRLATQHHQNMSLKDKLINYRKFSPQTASSQKYTGKNIIIGKAQRFTKPSY